MINSFAAGTFFIGVVAATLGALWILFPCHNGALFNGFRRFLNRRSQRFRKFTDAFAARLLFVGGLAAIGLAALFFFFSLLHDKGAGVSLLLTFLTAIVVMRKAFNRFFHPEKNSKQL